MMISVGVKMMREYAADLLDHRVPDRMQEQIRGILAAAGLQPHELVRVRTRRSGSLPQVELTLAPDHCFSLADFQQRVSDIRRTVESQVPELDVAIFIESEVP